MGSADEAKEEFDVKIKKNENKKIIIILKFIIEKNFQTIKIQLEFSQVYRLDQRQKIHEQSDCYWNYSCNNNCRSYWSS
jgi:hypothetical protein